MSVVSDIDECKIYGSCSQECFNTKGSYLCKCKPGYDISHATNSCKAFGKVVRCIWIEAICFYHRKSGHFVVF